MTQELNLKTVTHIAEPEDSRCRWWQAEIPEISACDLADKVDLKYYKKGADLELTEGTMLIDSEAKHHNKMRGYVVCLGYVCAEKDKVRWIKPNLAHKKMIKAEGHQDLMVGSGDVAAVMRLAIWLRRQDDKKAAFEKLRATKEI
jgi:hypothetical protein